MGAYNEFEAEIRDLLWAWADQYHRGQLDDGKRLDRPPVLAKQFAAEGILVPPSGREITEIRAAIPASDRHRWFRSLKSSQALTQSVFGAIRAFDCLNLLHDVPAECGRPAFFDSRSGWSIEFEHEISVLNEPRPTNVDVFLRRPGKRVAIECKFMEREFGTCSRPRLRPKDSTYERQFCDGNYRIQRGRSERCALTEIGIRYWEFLPHLFDWPADHDLLPCRFGEVYQLARNALAATVGPDGKLSATSGHALLLYDARNPEFQSGGKAEQQWLSAIVASRVPGLLRRLSWQRLLRVLEASADLSYLVEAINQKYGLKPVKSV